MDTVFAYVTGRFGVADDWASRRGLGGDGGVRIAAGDARRAVAVLVMPSTTRAHPAPRRTSSRATCSSGSENYVRGTNTIVTYEDLDLQRRAPRA